MKERRLIIKIQKNRKEKMAQFEDSTTLPHSVYEIVDRHPGASVYM